MRTSADAAGVVLAGGRSSRMGSPKAAMEWHGSTLLRRIVGVLARAVDGPVVVVRAPGQPLPALPGYVRVVEDPAPGLGPLQGIAAGLGAVAGRAPVAFVCATDLPLLHPRFVHRVLRAVGPGVDVALPVAHGFPQPLAAAYRTALAPRITALLAAGRLRPGMLLSQVRVERIDQSALLADPLLAAVDPELDSLLNLNSPEDYRAARARPAPAVTVVLSGAPAARGAPDTQTPTGTGGGPGAGGRAGAGGAPDASTGSGRVVRAATLGAAATAAGLAMDDVAVVAIDGEPVDPDPELPLVAGDSVRFAAAQARPAG